jgi:hypothetical protein
MPKVPKPQAVASAPRKEESAEEVERQRKMFGRSGKSSTVFAGLKGGAGGNYSSGVQLLGGSGGSV